MHTKNIDVEFNNAVTTKLSNEYKAHSKQLARENKKREEKQD